MTTRWRRGRGRGSLGVNHSTEGRDLTSTAITRAGLARLAAELERLETEARAEVADRIKHAVSTEANAAESADYLDAREEQAALEQRIAVLAERIAAAEVVEPDPANGVADVGERIRVRDVDTGRRHVYELVGTHEVDPLSGRISVASPVGLALLGRARGELVSVDVPRGTLRLKILAIEPAAEAAA